MQDGVTILNLVWSLYENLISPQRDKAAKVQRLFHFVFASWHLCLLAVKTIGFRIHLYFGFRCLVSAASTASPLPSRSKAAGSGTALKLRLSSAKVETV